MAFRTLITFAVVASALGFSPSSRAPRASSMTMAITDLPGAVAPLGFFDPAGIFIYSISIINLLVALLLTCLLHYLLNYLAFFI